MKKKKKKNGHPTILPLACPSGTSPMSTYSKNNDDSIGRNEPNSVLPK